MPPPKTLNMEERLTILKSMLLALFSMLIDFFFPIHQFVYVIGALATANIFFGLAADNWDFQFKKAFKAILYLLGYIGLLLACFGLGVLMEEEVGDMKAFTKWITYVMVWFYTSNSLKNWNKWQPDNRVIEFLYWVVSFKLVEKVNFLGEFLNHKRNGEHK